MAGNFSTLLWLKLFDELERRYGMPASAAHPYLARVTANVIAEGRGALTGPLVRGDQGAIRANLDALEGDPFHVVYAAFVRAYEKMKSVLEFAAFKAEGRRISMVTAYDAWSARLIARSNVDAVLVGDSVAMVMHGYPTTLPATVELMATHTRAVARAIDEKLLITDLPFLSFRKGVPPAMDAVKA